MKLLSALLCGLLFGIGLIISGMVNPLKVQNFLDISGAWDPSLALVMAGAILVGMPGFRLLQGRSRPLFSDRFRMPTRTDIDTRLIAGAVIFGVGWGLSGFCPGPVMTAVSMFEPDVVLFFCALIAGMWGGRGAQRWSEKQPA